VGKTMAKGLLVLAFVSFEAAAQFCPGLSPWVFTDVPSNHPFCTVITWMAERGVTVGCASLNATQRLYCPDQSVRRDQMAAFMHRLADEAVFQQGGNAFGVAGELGTTDNQALEIIVNN